MPTYSFIEYEVCEVRGSHTSNVESAGEKQDKLKQTCDIQFQVVVSEDRVGGGAPVTSSEVSPALISSLPELPLVNGTTYDYNGFNNPYMPCRSKDVERDEGNGLRFTVSCTFETDILESETQSLTVPSLTDITPIVTSEIGFIERAMYTDKDGKDCFRLPTGTPYGEPVMEKIPTLSLKITQYEAGITYDICRAPAQSSRTSRRMIQTEPLRATTGSTDGTQLGRWSITGTSSMTRT